MLEPRLIKTAH